LIEKTETEEAPREETGEDTGQAFTFAKVWTAENEVLELEDQELEHTETTDTWAHALELIAKGQAQVKAAERTGRGVRRKAAIAAENQVQSVVNPTTYRCTHFLPAEIQLFGHSSQRQSPRKETKEIQIYSVRRV